jgi:glucose-6-phosphate 1-epimerase
MPADGWRHMLCVEAACARQPVVLPPGEEWYGRQTLVAV